MSARMRRIAKVVCRWVSAPRPRAIPGERAGGEGPKTRGRSVDITLPDIPLSDGIPRKLHQVFLSDGADLPAKIRDNIGAIRAMHPGWDHRLYDEAAAMDFIGSVYGDVVQDIYQRISPAYPAARADFLRYLVCYAEGGVYLDLKSTTMRPLDEILKPDDRFLINQWKEFRGIGKNAGPHRELWHVPGGEYANWFIASARGHPFLRAVIEQCIANILGYRPLVHGVGKHGILRLTGPVMFTRTIHPLREANPHRHVILDPDEGVRYSIYDDFAQHRGSLGRHYSELTLPIVRGPAWSRYLAVGLYGHVLPRVRWFRGAVGRRLSAIRRAVARVSGQKRE